MAKISSTEVADELAAVKFELKRLHGIIFKDTTITNRGVAGGSAVSARADPKFWPNSTVLLPVPTLNYSLFLLVPTLTKIPSYGPVKKNLRPDAVFAFCQC